MLCELHHIVSDISASRVLQPRNVPSGVSKKKKKAFSSGGVIRGAAKFRVFLLSDKHDRRYVSVHVACGFNLMKILFPDAWMANEKGAAEGVL